MAKLPRVATRWRHLYQRWLGAHRNSTGLEPQTLMAGDGNQAVGLLESLLADAWSGGGSWPVSDLIPEIARQAEDNANLFGRIPSRLDGEGPRGALAAALGAALSGLRSTAFLSGPDLSSSLDLLREAARRRVALVVHLGERAGGGRTSLRGTSHDHLHLAADSGALLFVPVNVQELADLTLLAHRVAELALVPVVVAMDGAETSHSVQEFRLPNAETLRGFIGDGGDVIDVPSASQERLFGARRRRIPRWHDAERPLLVAPEQDESLPALAAASRQLMSDRDASKILDRVRSELAALTGRDCGGLRLHNISGAKHVLLALGSAVEVLEATSDKLEGEGDKAPGIVGLRTLHPFPTAELLEVIGGRRVAAVLERSDAPGSVEPPLLRSLRSALERAYEGRSAGRGGESSKAALAPREVPRLLSVFYGVGSAPLAASDVAALCSALDGSSASPLYLGLDFSPDGELYPKQAAELGAVSRSYPGLAAHGLPNHRAALDVRPGDAVSVATLHPASTGSPPLPLVSLAGDLLIRLAGGHLRTHRVPAAFGTHGVDLNELVHCDSQLRNPGDDAPIDLVYCTAPGKTPMAAMLRALRRLTSGGVFILEQDDGPLAESSLTPELQKLLVEREARVLLARRGHEGDHEVVLERRIGSLLGAIARRGWRDIHPRKLAEARDEMLSERGIEKEDRMPLVEHLTAAFEAVEEIDPSDLAERPQPVSSAASPRRNSVTAPPTSDTEAPLASLPRFWDQVGVLYGDDESAHLAPQPALTAPTLPPLSSMLSLGQASAVLPPDFDASLCTGCGACWTACPDGAINPLVLSPSALLEGCIGFAQAQGESVEAMRMLVGKLGSALGTTLAAAEQPAVDLPDLLVTAFEKVMAKTRLSDERKGAAEDAFAHLQGTLAKLPIIRTSSFFDRAEKREKGSGEIFALAIDPEACKECGLCVAQCEPAALSSASSLSPSRGQERLEELVRRWTLSSALPSPSPGTLERARENPDLNPLAVAMLDRDAQTKMTGRDLGEAGAGDKLAVRQILTAAWTRLAPAASKTFADVRDLQTRMAEAIQEKLASAIPADDLLALGQGLATLARPESNLKDLLGRFESAIEDTQVDVTRLKRLVANANELADLSWRLEKGEGGWGRQPLGLVVGPGRTGTWIGPFPFNPFAIPVTMETNGHPSEMAVGIASGLEQQTVALARAMRRARVELERPNEAVAGEAQLRKLTWMKLTSEERAACPALFLITSESEIASSGLAGLLDLLATDHPIKVILLSDLELVDGSSTRRTGPWTAGGATLAADPGIMALSQSVGYVAQTSIAHPEHLAASVSSALSFEGPALIRVYAPSPSSHGFAADQTLERARQAVATRAFPLYSSPPPTEAGGLRPLDLEGNPGLGYDWYQGLTPAHWALEEARFSPLFGKTNPESAEPLASYLRMPPNEREGKSAYLEGKQEEERVGLDGCLVAAVERASAIWRSLNAWSKVERYLEEAESREAERLATAELKRQHHDELAELAREHQTRLTALHAEIEADLTKRIRSRLVQLALNSSRPSNAEPGS